ncbi:DUF4238 domain-containing protein [Thioclava litoralis]|uniref:DUF4238 domain-containing protein n=1 Tax=Thioclava litoralis TaxID=3076557 RepID=A0ABZ1E2R1_9RHOB|nr:DUF4238 domain-containing protein [Thioclava sp. FTW29]
MTQVQAAQNQHYVPKFLLRNFLVDPKKEQVHVFSKSSGRGFTTSIKNIMAERRFHEFSIDENYLASFEESVCRVEDMLLPAYRSVVENRRFDGTPDQKAHLAMLMAFQFLRTRSQRDQFAHLERQLADRLNQRGVSIEDIEGYEPLTDDVLREQHIRFMRDAAGEFAQIIGAKDFLLIKAPKGRQFYLSDNPVTIHNNQPQDGLRSNMGLSCEGIEIYMPLTSDLQLCAWCPSILENIKARNVESNRQLATIILSPAMVNVANPTLLQEQLAQLRKYRANFENTLSRAAEGVPLSASNENMDFLNALQIGQAREHLICQKADFDLAKRFVAENPNFTGGRISIS